MRGRERIARKGWLYIFVVTAILGLFAVEVWAEDDEGGAIESKAPTVNFHGYLEANVVLRDEDGVQYGFLDHLNGVQQRNTLKFDVTVQPHLQWGNFGIEKFQMTYRGAYDSIFDLRANKFGDISEKGGPTRFDYGLRDIRFENDLREAFVDFTYDGPLGSAFFRPGRQLVSWGEASPSSTSLDVINPADSSYQMFFQNLDDVKIPLWMARLNYTLPQMSGVKLNFDFLWVPDIRPVQLAPRDSVAGNPTAGMNAPYAFTFGGLRGRNVREVVPTEKQEYGAKVTADMGLLSISAAYFRDVVSSPGVAIDPVTSTALFTHDTQNVYGAYFSYLVAPLDLVLRGEIAQHTAEPVSIAGAGTAGPGVDRLPNGNLATFRSKGTTLYVLAIDKRIRRWLKWLVPHEPVGFSMQWTHRTINGWDAEFDTPPGAPDAAKTGRPVKNQDIFEGNFSGTWFEGRLGPVLGFGYIPGKPGEGGGSGYIHPRLYWQIGQHLYSMLGMQAFLGDRFAKTGFAGLLGTSEVTLKIGYEW